MTTKQAIRQIIVMRRIITALNKLSRAHYIRKYRDQMVLDMTKLADKHGVKYALVTRKF